MAKIITKAYDNPNVTQQGEFMVGRPAAFYFTFPDSNGDLFDPSNIDIEILNSSQVLVDSATTVEKLQTGYYVWVWDVPTTTVPGAYYLKVIYTAEEEYGPIEHSYTEAFVVSETETNYISQDQLTRRRYLESLIGYAQRTPVFDEIGRLNKDRTYAEFSFPRWNQPSPTKVYVNGKLTDMPYAIDYMQGRVNFTYPLMPSDEVTASYTFRWFTDDELDFFIEQGIQIFNQYPPVSMYRVWNIPPHYGITAYEQAAVIALRRLMMDLIQQEPAKVFGGMERADKVFGNLDTLKKNYEDEIKQLYENKKNGPYAGLTKTVTVPEYTLPGGRCLSRHSLIVYEKNRGGELPTTHYGTIEEMYVLFEDGFNLRVQSDCGGELGMEPVSKIWKSGDKPLLRIQVISDSHGGRLLNGVTHSIDVTHEHIMFTGDNKTVLAGEMKIGDTVLMTYMNHVGVQTIGVGKIESIYGISSDETYDIEVPGTENLFANGIKCHNSRWFRYLFKGA